MKEQSEESERTGKILLSVNESIINFLLDKYEYIVLNFKRIRYEKR